MWQRTLSACAALSALIIGCSAVLVACDVLARNLGLPSVSWIVDMTEYALPLATLLVAPWLAFTGGHIKIDLLTLCFSVPLQKVLSRFISVCCAALCVLLTWYSISVLMESYETGAVVIKSIVFAEWWIYLPLPFCFSLLSIEFLRQAFGATTRASASEN